MGHLFREGGGGRVRPSMGKSASFSLRAMIPSVRIKPSECNSRRVAITAAMMMRQTSCYGPSGSGPAGTRSVGCSPDKPMLLISSSHEKQTAIKPRVLCQRITVRSLSGTAPVPSISHYDLPALASAVGIRSAKHVRRVLPAAPPRLHRHRSKGPAQPVHCQQLKRGAALRRYPQRTERSAVRSSWSRCLVRRNLL